jgi:hypothetical protein
LLVEADQHGFPADLLPHPTAEVAARDWHRQFEESLNESLNHVERQWSNPSGVRGWLQAGLVWLANIVPELTLIGAILALLWRYFMTDTFQPTVFSVLLPFLITLVVLILFHLLINLLLPLRWPKIRNEFQRQLQRRLFERLAGAYGPLPGEVNAALAEERKQIERLQAEADEVNGYLDQQQRAAHIEGLYGA